MRKIHQNERLMEQFVLIDAGKLQNIIKTAGISKKSICNEMDIPFITLRRWLNGDVKKLRSENFDRLSKILGCSPADIQPLENSEVSSLGSTELRNVVHQLDTNHYFNSMLFNCWQSSLLIFKALLRPDLQKSAKKGLYYRLGIFYFLNSKLDKLEEIFEKLHQMYPDLDTMRKSVFGTFRNNPGV